MKTEIKKTTSEDTIHEKKQTPNSSLAVKVIPSDDTLQEGNSAIVSSAKKTLEDSEEVEKKIENPLEAIEKAIRELVREELNKESAPQKKLEQPTSQDAFWLFILIGNISIILWLVPETLLASKRLDLITKLIPWLGSSAFVLGYTWFREKILRFIQVWSVRISQMALFVFLLLFQLPIFYVRPVIFPDDAQLKINDETKPRKRRDSLWVPLSSHTIELTPQKKYSSDELTKAREIELSYIDILLSGWGYGRQPQWSLRYQVILKVPNPESIILIHKQDSFDKDFQDETQKTFLGTEVNQVDEKTLQIKGNEKESETSYTLELPFGDYRIEIKLIHNQDKYYQKELKMSESRSQDSFNIDFKEIGR